jgi:hypothetical protein
MVLGYVLVSQILITDLHSPSCEIYSASFNLLDNYNGLSHKDVLRASPKRSSIFRFYNLI